MTSRQQEKEVQNFLSSSTQTWAEGGFVNVTSWNQGNANFKLQTSMIFQISSLTTPKSLVVEISNAFALDGVLTSWVFFLLFGLLMPVGRSWKWKYLPTIFVNACVKIQWGLHQKGILYYLKTCWHLQWFYSSYTFYVSFFVFHGTDKVFKRKSPVMPPHRYYW